MCVNQKDWYQKESKGKSDYICLDICFCITCIVNLQEDNWSVKDTDEMQLFTSSAFTVSFLFLLLTVVLWYVVLSLSSSIVVELL